jgi:hypothetical protein
MKEDCFAGFADMSSALSLTRLNFALADMRLDAFGHVKLA